MSRELMVVYTAANLPQAFLLKNLLAEYGVTAHVLNEASHSLGEAPTNWRVLPRVAVASQDGEFAREVAEDFDKRLRVAAQSAARMAVTDKSPPTTWEHWPACPQCGQRRSTFCPSCDTRGTDFPLAEFVPSTRADQPIQFVADGKQEPGEPVQLVCHVCDEVFPPKFQRRCAGCGHDFGNGLEPRAAAVDPDEQLNHRAATLFGVLLVLAIAILLILSLAWRRG